MIRFPCPACGRQLSAPVEAVGRSSKCKCGQAVTVEMPVASLWPKPEPAAEPTPSTPRSILPQLSAAGRFLAWVGTFAVKRFASWIYAILLAAGVAGAIGLAAWVIYDAANDPQPMTWDKIGEILRGWLVYFFGNPKLVLTSIAAAVGIFVVLIAISPRKEFSKEEDDEHEVIDEPRSRPRERRGFRCPYCRSSHLVINSRVSTGGVVFIVVCLFSCMLLPFFWLGFFIREDYRSCGDCGITLG